MATTTTEVVFRDNKVLFDPYNRVSFCNACRCGDSPDNPVPDEWPEQHFMPSCVVVRRTLLTLCEECDHNLSFGTQTLPLAMIVDGEEYSGICVAIPEAEEATPEIVGTITLTASTAWVLTLECVEEGVGNHIVWQGEKDYGTTPVGTYIRTDGCDDMDQALVQ
jgi:hypothetical protein